MTPTNITDQIARDEGFVGSAYPDSLGYWTIGSGVCIDSRKGCGITPAENSMLVSNRLTRIQDQLSETFPWTDALDPVRRAVLWNMAYQMGIAGLAQFKDMLVKLQSGDLQGAAAAMLQSTWAEKQSPARAARLSVQLVTGEWQ